MLYISYGSVCELETQILLAGDLGFIEKGELGPNEQKEIRRSNMNLNEILHGSGARGRQGDMTFDSALADEDERKVEIMW